MSRSYRLLREALLLAGLIVLLWPRAALAEKRTTPGPGGGTVIAKSIGSPNRGRLEAGRELVSSDAGLVAAIAVEDVVFNLARVAGPAFAGVLIAAVGLPGAYAVDLATFAASRVARTMGVTPRVATHGGRYEDLLRAARIDYDLLGPPMSAQRSLDWVQSTVGLGDARQSAYTDDELRVYVRAEAAYLRTLGIRVAARDAPARSCLRRRRASAASRRRSARRGRAAPPERR